MYGPIGHGFGGLAAVFAAIVWSIGVFVLLVIVITLAVLLARFLWVGTKVAQRYLEVNGSPTPRPRSTAPASTTPASTTPAASSASAAAPTTTSTAPKTAPTANTTAATTTGATKPLPKAKAPKPPTS
jgi:cytoskeletal protein RodZ